MVKRSLIASCVLQECLPYTSHNCVHKNNENNKYKHLKTKPKINMSSLRPKSLKKSKNVSNKNKCSFFVKKF